MSRETKAAKARELAREGNEGSKAQTRHASQGPGRPGSCRRRVALGPSVSDCLLARSLARSLHLSPGRASERESEVAAQRPGRARTGSGRSDEEQQQEELPVGDGGRVRAAHLQLQQLPLPCGGPRRRHFQGVPERIFQGRNGRAYLFQNVVNVLVGPKEDRQLMTGLHTVADIQCHHCQEVLGWKYEKAYDEAQKYKEGKYILEKAKVMKEDW